MSPRRIRNSLAVCNYLHEHRCVDCGEDDIATLQFDHRGEKRAKISKMIQSHSIKSIFDEIKKCDIRCANCHAKKTARDFHWYENLEYCEELDILKAADINIRNKRRVRNSLAVCNYLMQHRCIDCGETDIATLQFDHRGEKRAKISRMIGKNSIKSIFDEIKKCDIRCANCHTKKTAIDFHWYEKFTYCDELDCIVLKDEFDESKWSFR